MSVNGCLSPVSPRRPNEDEGKDTVYEIGVYGSSSQMRLMTYHRLAGQTFYEHQAAQFGQVGVNSARVGRACREKLLITSTQRILALL